MVFSVHINSLEYFKTFQLPWIIMHCPLPSQEYDLFSALLKFLELITSASEPLPERNRFNEKTLHPASFILNVKRSHAQLCYFGADVQSHLDILVIFVAS